MNEESERLLAVAGAVADGAAVSWDDEARQATDNADDAAILRGLRDLEGILSAQRHISRAFDSTTKKRDTAPEAGPAEPPRWRHLVILDKIGEGSFGTVYRAYDSQLAVDVALKLSHPQTARSANQDHVLGEARRLARVRHPNVVTVYGVDQTEDRIGLWMELIKGQTLEELLTTQGTFGAHEAALVGRDVCRAIAAVHQASLLHGDIKAYNVMRQEGGRTVLMDFGAGRTLADDKSHPDRRHLAGTPAYLAPEVLDGQPQSKSSDLYALGVLLYHLVTGSYPVIADSPTAILAAHDTGKRRHLRDARPDLPDDFVRVVEQATAVDPTQRFASAGAFEAALARLTLPNPPEPGALVSRAKLSFSAVPRSAMLLATLALLVIGGPTAVWLGRSSNPAPESASVGVTTPPSMPSPVVGAAPYEIHAAFYRAGRNGEEQLAPGVRLAPGDELFLKFQASVPINLYVVNEDEKGDAFRLFPMPGERQTNPLQANQPITLPGTSRWQVSTPGEREHFIVFASPDRLEWLEQAFAALSSPQENTPVLTLPRLPSTTIERLRAVGGLTPSVSRQDTAAALWRLFTTPLTNARESVRGLWVRQITLDNPAR